MTKIVTIKRKCPVCNYVYEIEHLIDVNNPEKKISLDEKILQGDEDFKFLYSDDAKDYSNDSAGIFPFKSPDFRCGMFCPKCGVFLNSNICTTNNQTSI